MVNKDLREIDGLKVDLDPIKAVFRFVKEKKADSKLFHTFLSQFRHLLISIPIIFLLSIFLYEDGCSIPPGSMVQQNPKVSFAHNLIICLSV